MITLKSILVATDFSECGDSAVKYGRELAEHFGAKLHVLHVVEDPYRYGWGVESLPFDATVVERWRHQALEHLLKSVPEEARAATRIACTVGAPVDEILRYAREHAIGMIVMGTHGRGAVAHAFLGSVAERVVRRAPCSVLTVHQLQHEFVRHPVAGTEAAAAH